MVSRTGFGYVVFIALALAFEEQAFGANATDVWKQVLKKCAASQQIGKETVFFGVSNAVGPGSVWRFNGDKSIRLRFELADAIGDVQEQQKVVVFNKLARCAGVSTTKFDIRLGLPFSLAADALSATLQAELRRAKKVEVSIDSFSIDNLKELLWLQAFAKLPEGSAYRKDLTEPNRIVAANAVKVGGLKAVFTFGSDVNVDAQATYVGKRFTIGQVVKESTATAGSPQNGQTAQPVATASESAPRTDSATSGSCPVLPPDTGGSPETATPASQQSSVLKVHVGRQSRNQIVLCAEGPFYLLAAYSTLVDGGLGVEGQRFQLRPASVPDQKQYERGK